GGALDLRDRNRDRPPLYGSGSVGAGALSRGASRGPRVEPLRAAIRSDEIPARAGGVLQQAQGLPDRSRRAEALRRGGARGSRVGFRGSGWLRAVPRAGPSRRSLQPPPLEGGVRRFRGSSRPLAQGF